MAYNPKLKELLIVQYNDRSVIDKLSGKVHQDDRPSFLIADPENLQSDYLKTIEKELGLNAIASASNEKIWLPFDGDDDIDAYARNRSGAYFIGLVGLAKKVAGLERIDDEQAVVISSKAVVESFIDYNPGHFHQSIIRIDRDIDSDRPFAEYNIHLLKNKA